ncbi:MAG TPA: hypothetical protein VHK23_02745 [Miltoncostaeaceae bacterium]|nr:hypothetical protein [Miltoncostaeaceae bacterium]
MIALLDWGRPVAFSFEDMLRYHGPGSPGGVAHAYKVLERGLPLLADGPPERRAVKVRTAFGGPGARDAFELALRAVTEGRYEVDPSLARPERGMALEHFVFLLAYRDQSVTLILRPGFVTEEFLVLSRRDDRDPDDERLLARWKLDMAERVMAAPAADVYAVEG